MMTNRARFSKFKRPEGPRRGAISDRNLDIIEVILCYGFSPTSELVRLVGGNEDVTQRRLLMLWERGIIDRFAFPYPRPHSEFICAAKRSGLFWFTNLSAFDRSEGRE